MICSQSAVRIERTARGNVVPAGHDLIDIFDHAGKLRQMVDGSMEPP